MKKLVLTAAIILGFVMGSYAQGIYQDRKATGGLFQRGQSELNFRDTQTDTFLPTHLNELNGDADDAPIGSGALLLIGFGAAYAMSKRNKKD